LECERRAKMKKKPIPYWVKTLVIERDGSICRICGKEGRLESLYGCHKIVYDKEETRLVGFDGEAPVAFEIDHIIPESLGGVMQLYNLRLTCRHCNRSKGAKHGLEANVI